MLNVQCNGLQVGRRPAPSGLRRTACAASRKCEPQMLNQPDTASCGSSGQPNRRNVLLALVAAPALLEAAPVQAIQGTIAGRIPGVSREADANGFFTYQRPEGKSGGHGVGWSEIPRYAFKVPAGWEETPVSIADLGGTEIDLRFVSKDEGELSIVVAPVLRFMDVGYNANIKIEDIGTPDKIIAGFAPELFGRPLNDDEVKNTKTWVQDGATYYGWELKFKNHVLVTATATRNRIFILSVQSNTRQWKKYSEDVQRIADSFYVPTA